MLRANFRFLTKHFGCIKGLTQDRLAHVIGVSFQTINLIVNGKRAVTADVALRLARYFKMTPQFWLNMQNAVDLHQAAAALESRTG
ncbi:MAG: HigA family addiction module antidote protein [Myxococcaceae bacterium]|nr:HigA family addiction module antidote protein [Myxococcaceae bacterium]